MKTKFKLLLILAIAAILMLFTGCSVETSSTLDIDDAFSGTRTFVATADKEIINEFKGKRKDLETLIEDSIPEGFDHELVTTDDNGLQLTLTASFTNQDEYVEKMNSLLKAGGINSSFEVSFDMSPVNDTFISNLEYQDNADNQVLLAWLDNIFKDQSENKSIFQNDYNNSLSLKYNNFEKTLTRKDGYYKSEDFRLYDPDSTSILLKALDQDQSVCSIVFEIPAINIDTEQIVPTEENASAFNLDMPSSVQNWLDNLGIEPIVTNKKAFYNSTLNKVFFLINLDGTHEDIETAINQVLQTNFEYTVTVDSSDESVLATNYAIHTEGSSDKSVFPELRFYLCMPNDARLAEEDSENSTNSGYQGKPSHSPASNYIAFNVPELEIPHTDYLIPINIINEQCDLNYSASLPVQELSIIDDLSSSSNIERSFAFKVNSLMSDNFNSMVKPKLEALGATITTEEVEEETQPTQSKAEEKEEKEETTTAETTNEATMTELAVTAEKDDQKSVLITAKFKSQDVFKLNDLTSRVLPLTTQISHVNTGLFTYQDILFHKMTGPHPPVRFKVYAPSMSKIRTIPFSVFKALDDISYSEYSSLTSLVSDLINNFSDNSNNSFQQYLQNLDRSPEEEAKFRAVMEWVKLWDGRRDSQPTTSPIFSNNFFNFLEPTNFYAKDAEDKLVTIDPSRPFEINEITDRVVDINPRYDAEIKGIYFVKGYRLIPIIVTIVSALLLIIVIIWLILFLIKRQKTAARRGPKQYPVQPQYRPQHRPQVGQTYNNSAAPYPYPQQGVQPMQQPQQPIERPVVQQPIQHRSPQQHVNPYNITLAPQQQQVTPPQQPVDPPLQPQQPTMQPPQQSVAPPQQPQQSQQ